MGWLALGAAYSILYAVIGAYLRPFPDVLPWFRIVALLLPPLVGRRRSSRGGGTRGQGANGCSGPRSRSAW